MKKVILAAIILAASSVHAQQFTPDLICDLLIDSGKANSIYMFVDAKDTSTSLKHKKFYTFRVRQEEKLGEFFGLDKTTDGSAMLTTQNNLSYNVKHYSFGRMLTQIEGIPTPVTETSEEEVVISADGTVPTKPVYYWNIYKLCKLDSCTNPDQSKVERGDWHMTTGFDDQILS
ncbi:MAG: hypothetical protein IT286_02310, partial [Proteobacteria bacterium]|nr:hypothetical protein [Pseudomonadota bacterium]